MLTVNFRGCWPSSSLTESQQRIVHQLKYMSFRTEETLACRSIPQSERFYLVCIICHLTVAGPYGTSWCPQCGTAECIEVAEERGQ